LTEFFRKTRELYPDYFLQADQTFVSGEHVITQCHYYRAFLRWTHQKDSYFDSWSLDRTY
jgi:hypothetical protein